MSDHIINGGHCLLFNCMVMHCVLAASLGAAVLVPIPEDKRKGLKYVRQLSGHCTELANM